jgi:uncharacterized membrane protein YhaH (DUF805 family)
MPFIICFKLALKNMKDSVKTLDKKTGKRDKLFKVTVFNVIFFLLAFILAIGFGLDVISYSSADGFGLIIIALTFFLYFGLFVYFKYHNANYSYTNRLKWIVRTFLTAFVIIVLLGAYFSNSSDSEEETGTSDLEDPSYVNE